MQHPMDWMAVGICAVAVAIEQLNVKLNLNVDANLSGVAMLYVKSVVPKLWNIDVTNN